MGNGGISFWEKPKKRQGTHPGVSVILPVYNRAHMIGRSIESVLAQTYTDFELLIVDDGSTDDTLDVVRKYTDERITCYRLEQNQGQSAARNYGMRRANYDYFAFEDSDDLWYPDKLELQMREMLRASEKTGMVYHKMKYEIDGFGTVVLPGDRGQKKNGAIFHQLLWDNMVGMPTLLVKRSCVEDVGFLDESMRCLEDYDWILRLAQKYEAVFIDRILLDAAYSDSGVSAQSYDYLIASCTLIQKYKTDYLASNTLNHRLECILRDAERLGIKEQIVQILEKIMML